MYIVTERLELKAMSEGDIGALADLLMDDVVKQTYMVPDFPDREGAIAMAQRICGLSQEPLKYIAGIYLEGRLIGMLNKTDGDEQKVEVGYALLPQYYGRGYATEALTGAIGYFLSQGYQTVLAGAFEHNAASLRVMAKSGMQLQEYTDFVEYRGKKHRCIYYAVHA